MSRKQSFRPFRLAWPSHGGPHYTLKAGTCTLLVLLASTGYSQTRPINAQREMPDFTVHVSAGIVDDFNTRVSTFVELRNSMEKGLIPLRITDDPDAIEEAESNLARKLGGARAGAKRGDVFTPGIEREFKKALIAEMDASTWATIMDDNPGEFPHRINTPYMKGKPFSTVPSNILALLPKLPDDIQYLFLGRHLILYDTRSHLIIDRISHAIRHP